MSPRATQFTSPKIRRLAERAMEGGKPLDRNARQELQRAMTASQQNRDAYDTLARCFSALETSAPALNQGQLEGILEVIQREVGATAPEPRPMFGWLRQLAPALAVLLVGFVVALALRPPGSDAVSTFQHRGSTAVGQDGKLGLKAFCVRDGEVLPSPRLTTGSALAARCHLDDELQLALTHTAGFSHLLVIGDLVDASGQHTLTWYHPAPPTGRSGDAPANVIDQVLGQSRRLSLNHQAGQLRLVAIFSRAPLAAQPIHAALRALERTALAGPALERVDAQGRVEVTAVDLHVKIEGGAR
jgi:hypothetical protein